MNIIKTALTVIALSIAGISVAAAFNLTMEFIAYEVSLIYSPAVGSATVLILCLLFMVGLILIAIHEMKKEKIRIAKMLSDIDSVRTELKSIGNELNYVATELKKEKDTFRGIINSQYRSVIAGLNND